MKKVRQNFKILNLFSDCPGPFILAKCCDLSFPKVLLKYENQSQFWILHLMRSLKLPNVLNLTNIYGREVQVQMSVISPNHNTTFTTTQTTITHNISTQHHHPTPQLSITYPYNYMQHHTQHYTQHHHTISIHGN